MGGKKEWVNGTEEERVNGWEGKCVIVENRGSKEETNNKHGDKGGAYGGRREYKQKLNVKSVLLIGKLESLGQSR